MTPAPEALARRTIDDLLTRAGWVVADADQVDLAAARGVAIREFPLAGGGFADYVLYVDGRACGVIEAKKQGATLTGVEVQSARYQQGLPPALPAWRRPLPFAYESTGLETHFTNGLDPDARARNVFAFHRPETLREWLDAALAPVAGDTEPGSKVGTFLTRVRQMPPLADQLWPPKPEAIANLERSLGQNRPRALVQMATGSGKTLLAIVPSYRLLKFAGARRILFLVDRGNLGRQAKKEFDQYTSPYNNRKFGEEYVVQHLTSNQIDKTARVCICTIQRMFSMLKGRELRDEADGESTERVEALFRDPEPIDCNPAFPIENFDNIVTDEAHRSIYNLWRQVSVYFDANLSRLTGTPNIQTFGFFNLNLVME